MTPGSRTPMPRRSIQFAAPAAALALALGLLIQVRSYAAMDDSAPFHARVREAVGKIPIQIGDWEGAEVPVPPAAGKLLRPNVLFCRNYRQLSTGRRATLLLVHCRDSRDMTGHYPPVCYPGHGWIVRAPVQHKVLSFWGRDVPMAIYQFSRSDVDRSTRCTIYNFFALPRGNLATEMSQVVAASADYRTRPYGAAQFQVVFDAGLPEPEQLQALHELLAPLGPVIDTMHLREREPHP
jgi:hypothetical protein